MRLFIGIDLPQEIKKSVHDYLVPLQKSSKGWEKSHDYHQTLLFIGETSLEMMAQIRERLHSIKMDPFELKTNGFQFFNRRIMYLGFKSSPELSALKELVEKTYPEWCRKEAKEFIPHVTVKRWQRYEYDDLVKGLEEPMRTLTFMVNHVALFKSEKDFDNNKYHIVEKKFF